MSETTSYIDQYRLFYESGGYNGDCTQTLNARDAVKDLIYRTGTQSLIDYGCGEAMQYRKHQLHNIWQIPEPTLYDPAIPEFAETPATSSDGVLCVDVLEHVPDADLDRTLADIFKHATKFVYLQICNRPARQILPNGENAHCTLMSHAEWVERIKRHWSGSQLVQIVTHGNDDGDTTLEPQLKTATVVAKGPSAVHANEWIEGDVATINDSIRLLDPSTKPQFCFFGHGAPLGEFPNRWKDVAEYHGPMLPWGDIPHGFPGHKLFLFPYTCCGNKNGRMNEQIRTGGVVFHHTTMAALHILAKRGYKRVRIIGVDGGTKYAPGVLVRAEPGRSPREKVKNYDHWRDVTKKLCDRLTEWYGTRFEWYKPQECEAENADTMEIQTSI